MESGVLFDDAVRVAVGEFVRRGIERVFRRNTENRLESSDSELSEALARHLREAAAWSGLIQTEQMRRPLETLEVTVPLYTDDVPRRFRTGDSGGSVHTEMAVLQEAGSWALLGEVGAGKTTTVKRLVQSLLRELNSDWIPLLLVLRDHDWSQRRLTEVLSEKLGLEMSSPAAPLTGDLLQSNPDAADRLQVVANYLDGGAVLFVDGLDEVPESARPALEADLRVLASYLELGKVVVTCRTPAYVKIEGLSLVELCGLTPEQISFVVERVLGERSERFFAELDGHPAADLLDRPLFLMQLITIFDNGTGDLPELPSRLSRRMVQLVVEKWDHENRVRRPSNYKRFEWQAKTEFLAALSFELTLVQGRTRFDLDELMAMYRKVAPRFSLPVGQARQVALEISSHTGLLIEGPVDNFEFCHLSLQEYLCADHLVRAPIGGLPATVLSDHPAVCAVAASLSSDPTAWVVALVFGRSFGERAAGEFLSRLGQERPRFVASVDLAGAILWLLMAAKEIDVDVVRTLAANKGVHGAVASFLSDGVKRRDVNTSVRVPDSVQRRRKELPHEFVLPNRVIDVWL